MTLYAICILSFAAFGLCVTEKLMLPVTTCKRNSTDYSACLTHAAQESWPRFVEGLPEFNFPRLDPLFYGDGKAVFDTNLLHGNLSGTNIIAKGFAKLHFLNIRTQYLDDAFRLEIDITIPRLFAELDINVDAALSGFRIHTNGHFNVTVEDISGKWDIRGHIVNDTAIIEYFIAAPHLGKVKAHFTDFEGNQELYDLIIDFVNEYWPAIYRGMLPIMYKTWEPRLIEISNRFFSKVSFSELFPEN